MAAKKIVFLSLSALLSFGVATHEVDRKPAMYGGTPSRNMVSEEKNLPSSWNIETGKNVKWQQSLGSQSYGGPVVAGDKIFMGTNNEGRRNPEMTGDRGVMMAFRTSDGKFLWQSSHPKLPAGRIHDWPLQGVCSAPYVEDNRLYYVSNRAELICADTEGFNDGENDGPYKEEKNVSKLDEDVVWKLDMIQELDVFPHNLAVGSPVVVGDLLFTVTGNGVDEGHINVPAPFAPDFIAVNKHTGEVVWENSSPGSAVLHGSWSNPAYGVLGEREQVVFPGGDGWLYSFDPETGNLIWKFNCNPKNSKWKLGGSGTKNSIIGTPVVHHNRVYIGVGQDPEHGEGPGNLWVIGGNLEGDVTGKAVVWHRGDQDFHRTLSTVAVSGEFLFIADLSGFLYCLDTESGLLHWTYDTYAAVWSSPFVADGKVYLGDEDGDIGIDVKFRKSF